MGPDLEKMWASIEHDFADLLEAATEAEFPSDHARRVILAATFDKEPRQNVTLWLVVAMELLLNHAREARQ